MDTNRIMVPVTMVLVIWMLTSVHAIDHGSNLIWAQEPHTRLLSLSRLMGISGDPAEWVNTKTPQVNFIAAPHFTWVFTSLGFHYGDQSLYWSEKMYRKIQRLTLNGSTVTTTLFIGTSPEVNGMTVDWLSRNLYFTDALYDWIMMIPSRPTQPSYRIVVNEGLFSPHGIVVHPSAGRLFWSDWGPAPKIESSDLLGQNRKVILQTNDLVAPKGLALDFQRDRLYWVDSAKSSIESIALDGSHRVIFQTKESRSSFYGLSLYGDFFFVTDRGRLGMLKVFTAKENVVNFKLSNRPYDIIMYHESQQPGNASDCEDMQCQQMCVLDPVKGAMCVCGDAFSLNMTDNVSCLPSKKFVHPTHIYAIGDSVCHYPANMADMALHNVNLDSQCFLGEHQGYMTLTYDARNNMLYYFANRTKTISRIPLESKGVGKVLAGGGGIVNGMSYDWIHGNLYWADTNQGIIYMCANACSFQTAVVERLAQPFALAVHPERGEMYWTSQGHLPDVAPRIEKSFMDGSKREIIMGDNLGTPTHIFVDYRKDILYWADSKMNHVRKYDLITGRISVFFQLPGVTFYGISIFKDYILWTDRMDQNGMHAARLDKKEKVRGIIHPKDGIASDLITFDILNQPIKNESAKFVNPCSQIYLKQGPTSYRCACGNGFEPVDGYDKLCVNRPVWNDFILVNDAYQRQIFQIDLRTGSMKALSMRPKYEPIALAFSPHDYNVFWSDNKAHVIKVATMGTGHESTVKVMSNVSMCDGLAVDYINQLLFYSDAGLDMIGAISLNNYDMRTTVIQDDLGEPRDLVVSSNEGLLYWSDWGTTPRIERAYMDGSGRETLVAFNKTAWPNGLALDIKENMLYWADAHADSISVMNVVTRKITLLIEEIGSHYFSMEVISEYLYVSDWTRNYLVRMNKRGGSMKRFGNGRFTKMYAIQGFNSSEMFQKPSVCANSACDHMCLPSSKDYSCRCNDGFDLVNYECFAKSTDAPDIVITGNNDSSVVMLHYPSTSPSFSSSSSSMHPSTPPIQSTGHTDVRISYQPTTSMSMTTSPPSHSTVSNGGIDVTITSTNSNTDSSVVTHYPSTSPSFSSSSSPPTQSTPASSPMHPSTPPITQSSTPPITQSTTPPIPQSTRHTDVTISSSPTTSKSMTSSPPLYSTVSNGDIDVTITSTNNPIKSTYKPTGSTVTPIAKQTSIKGSTGLSPLLIGAIVGAVVILLIIAIIVAVVLRRNRNYSTGHWKLREDSTASDSNVFYEAHGDSISFESGITNPTYDYLHTIPVENTDLNEDGFGLAL